MPRPSSRVARLCRSGGWRVATAGGAPAVCKRRRRRPLARTGVRAGPDSAPQAPPACSRAGWRRGGAHAQRVAGMSGLEDGRRLGSDVAAASNGMKPPSGVCLAALRWAGWEGSPARAGPSPGCALHVVAADAPRRSQTGGDGATRAPQGGGERPTSRACHSLCLASSRNCRPTPPSVIASRAKWDGGGRTQPGMGGGRWAAAGGAGAVHAVTAGCLGVLKPTCPRGRVYSIKVTCQ